MTERVFDIRFATQAERTQRVLEVAEAFGLGLAKSEFVVYENLRLMINRGDVVYITGQSGSGKSLLLRALAQKLEDEGDTIARIDDFAFDDRPLIDQVGSSMTEAAQILGQAGISDAYLFVQKPAHLSDGQRYRARLAKVIESKAQVWVADEFGALLDRPTAKAVAFNVARAARQVGATLIVATTHTDLVEELGPSVTIRKVYRERVTVERAEAV